MAHGLIRVELSYHTKFTQENQSMSYSHLSIIERSKLEHYINWGCLLESLLVN